jgi:hypothetical protein
MKKLVRFLFVPGFRSGEEREGRAALSSARRAAIANHRLRIACVVRRGELDSAGDEYIYHAALAVCGYEHALLPRQVFPRAAAALAGTISNFGEHTRPRSFRPAPSPVGTSA